MYQAVKTSNVASICSHNAVNSDKPLLRTSTAGGPTKSINNNFLPIVYLYFYSGQI